MSFIMKDCGKSVKALFVSVNGAKRGHGAECIESNSRKGCRGI